MLVILTIPAKFFIQFYSRNVPFVTFPEIKQFGLGVWEILLFLACLNDKKTTEMLKNWLKTEFFQNNG